MSYVIGIDPGSNALGYGIIRAGRVDLTYVDAGVITAPKAWGIGRRLEEIGRCLDEVCAEFLARRRDDEELLAGIEQGFVMGGGRGADTLVLGAARGIALERLYRHLKIEPKLYYPATVKKAVTGNGKAEKSSVAMFVARLLGLAETPGPDVADALACAITRARDVG